MLLNRAKGQKGEERMGGKDAQASGEDGKIERTRYEENVKLMRSSRLSRQDGIKARRKASAVYKSDNMTVITHGPV